MTHVFSNFHNPLSKRDLIILGVATLLGGIIYLVASQIVYRIGFPLDDAWIHLTFARNLAHHGEWSFRLGIPSAGSTSPLWSALLAIGFILHLEPYIWPYFLGLLTIWALSVISEITSQRLIPTYRPAFPWVGIFIIVEWHLLWAAMSGMETLLHALIATVVLSAIMMNSRRYLTLGLLVGISVWVRPDGLTLLGPLFFAVVLNEKDTSARLKALLQVFVGFGAVFLFYLLFNLLIGGTPMPNTFYAKQAEYANWQQMPILERLGELLLQLLVSPAFLLLPGMVLWVIKAIKARDWGTLLALAWSLGYMVIYLLRLPVYQHGRYIIPAMPIFFLIGLLGMFNYVTVKREGRNFWMISTSWNLSLAMVTFLFIVLGARAYARDVAFIEQEMVAAAKWTASNIPPDAILAVHDIGAMGYFDEHQLIDLAGLITPEVIPFIRDEDRLTAYLDQNNADYLIAFSDLYPQMETGREVVFVTNGAIATEVDWVRMTIYRWK